MRVGVRQGLLFFGVTALLCSGVVFAQTSASTTVTASAQIVQGIAIVRTADLNFGDIAPSGAGTVVVSPLGARTSTGGASVIDNPSNPAQAAAFDVMLVGNPGNNNAGNKKFWIQLPPNGTVSITNGSATMNVNDFTSNLPCAQTGSTAPGPGPCVQAPRTLQVGASLLVNAGQPIGVYSGTFNVTVHRF